MNDIQNELVLDTVITLVAIKRITVKEAAARMKMSVTDFTQVYATCKDASMRRVKAVLADYEEIQQLFKSV